MRGVAGGDEGGGDGASTNMPIAPRDTSDGRVSGLVIKSVASYCSLSYSSSNLENFSKKLK